MSDLSFYSGDIIQLSGESGAGKTLFGLGLMGLVANKSNFELDFEFDEETHQEENQLTVWRASFCAMIFQQPKAYFHPVISCYEQIIEASNYDSLIESEAIFSEYILLLELPELNSLKNTYRDHLSIGQLQRLMIIMALMKRPKFIIADEIFAHLDYKLAIVARKLISEYINENEAACLIFSHDNELLDGWTTDEWFLKEGVLSKVDHSVILNEEANKYFIEKDKNTNDIILELKNINKSFYVGSFFSSNKIEKLVLNDFNFTIRKGARIGLIGASGSGKSTISKIICQIEKYDSGEVNSSFEELTYGFWKRQNSPVQMVFQDPYLSLNPSKKIKYQFKKLDSNKVMRLMNNFGMGLDLLDHKPSELSGGQLQRLSIISALSAVPFPQLLILDEAFSALDANNVNLITELLNNDFPDLAIIYISHRMGHLERLCDVFYLLKEGQINRKVLNQSDDYQNLKIELGFAV